MDTETDTRQNCVKSEKIVTQSDSPKNDARKERIYFILLIFGLQISLFLSALDITILATSLPTIGSEFQAMSISSWIVTSYTMTAVVFQPLLAKFSDIMGRKTIMMFSLGVFLLGSILCSISKTAIMLIAFRAVQGLGAAGIGPMINIILSDIIPLEKLGSYQGITSAVYALASVVGPLIGGSLTDRLSWRWNFYINLPVGAAAIVLIYLFLDIPMKNQGLKDKLRRIDYAGSLLILSATTLLLTALNFGGQTYPWVSVAVIVPLVLSGVLIVILVFVEVKVAKEPLLPPRIFRNRTVIGTFLVALFYGMSFMGILYYLPVYLQGVRGDSAMWSGIHILPMEASSKAFSIGGGFFISKFGVYRFLCIGGMVILTLSIGLFSLFSVETSWPMIYGMITVAGVGIGVYFATSIIAIRASVERRDIAVALGLQRFTFGVGCALGIASASAAFNSALRKSLPKAIPIEYANQVFQSPDFIRNGLPSNYFDATISAYANSVKSVWQFLAIMSGLGLLSTLLIKEYSLRQGPAATKPHDEKQADKQPQVINVDSE